MSLIDHKYILKCIESKEKNMSFKHLIEDFKKKLDAKFYKTSDDEIPGIGGANLELILEELAEIKAQILEISLKHEQISGLEFLNSIKYDPSPGISNFPIFSANKKFDVCSDVLVYNMHTPIKTKKNVLVRWSGPEQIFGMMVRLDRSVDLYASIQIIAKGTPDININLIEIDGNLAEVKTDAERISFIVPKKTLNSLGGITNLCFKTSKSSQIGDVKVGVCMKYVELTKI